jgi:hypothetical protein
VPAVGLGLSFEGRLSQTIIINKDKLSAICPVPDCGKEFAFYLDWNNRIIFVPDSKTVDGRRMIPMSDRAYEVLRARAAGRGHKTTLTMPLDVWEDEWKQ